MVPAVLGEVVIVEVAPVEVGGWEGVFFGSGRGRSDEYVMNIDSD